MTVHTMDAKQAILEAAMEAFEVPGAPIVVQAVDFDKKGYWLIEFIQTKEK